MTTALRLTLAALAAGALAAVPASATAATIHVAPGGADAAACGAPATPCQTLPYALLNRVTPDPDLIQIAAGEMTMAGFAISNANAAGDTVQGAGSQGLPGGTVLKHGNSGEDAQLVLNVPMTVRGLSIQVPAGAAAARTGLALSNTAGGTRIEDVAVAVANTSSGIIVANGGAPNVVFDRLRVSGNHAQDALNSHVATGAVIQDSDLRGGTGPSANAFSLDGGSAVVRRSRLHRDFAAPGFDAVVSAVSSDLTVESSLITGGRIGIASQAGPPLAASLTLRSVTIDIANAGVADIPPDRNPIYVRTTMPGAATSTALVERSILVEPVYAFLEAGSTVKVGCVDSLVPAENSALIACGPANANSPAAPLDVFVNPLGGDFHPKPGRAAIDGAAGAVAAGESATDLDGQPRVQDGNHDGLARIDRGAFEFNPGPPPICGCLPTGQPPAPRPPAANRAPLLSLAHLARRSFPVTGRLRGTRLRFRLSEAAAVAVTVERRLAGRRVRSMCRPPTRRNRRAKACVRYVRVGTLRFAGRAGANSKPLTGRVGKGVLAAGSYRLRLIAKDAQGKPSAERRLAFTVLR